MPPPLLPHRTAGRPDRPGRWPHRWAPGAALGVLLLAAGCSTGGVAASTTVTVERTVTVNAAAPAADTVSTDAGAADSGSAAPSDGIPEHADACEVLTRPEAQTVAARRLKEAAPAGVEFGKATYCTYSGYPEDPGVGQIEVFIGDGSKKALDIDKDTLKHEFSQVEGVGDECWAEDGQIFFRSGSTWASIRVVMLEEDPEKAGRLEAAARLVVSRLP